MQKPKSDNALVGSGLEQDAKVGGYAEGPGYADKSYHPNTIDQQTAFGHCNDILVEYRDARKKFNPMRGAHEGYAVILEELDEAWDAIKDKDLVHAKKEIKQVAAMCLAFLVEVEENT